MPRTRCNNKKYSKWFNIKAVQAYIATFCCTEEHDVVMFCNVITACISRPLNTSSPLNCSVRAAGVFRLWRRIHPHRHSCTELLPHFAGDCPRALLPGNIKEVYHMVDYREILRLTVMSYSLRQIGKQCLWLTTKPKIKIPAGAEFTFLLVRKPPKTSETNRIGLAAHLKNA